MLTGDWPKSWLQSHPVDLAKVGNLSTQLYPTKNQHPSLPPLRMGCFFSLGCYHPSSALVPPPPRLQLEEQEKVEINFSASTSAPPATQGAAQPCLVSEPEHIPRILLGHEEEQVSLSSTETRSGVSEFPPNQNVCHLYSSSLSPSSGLTAS